jgi:hypothetical protein
MWQCHYCRSPLSLEIQRKNRLCPSCGSDIHCCLNCIHYDEDLSSKCREPNSPWVHNRETQNSCTFFEFRPVPPAAAAGAKKAEATDASSEAERAKEAFRALFRNP